MSESYFPARGTIITYLTPDGGAAAFVRGVVTGPGIVDPETGAAWVPVCGIDRAITLLDPEVVVDVMPSSRPPRDSLADHWITHREQP